MPSQVVIDKTKDEILEMIYAYLVSKKQPGETLEECFKRVVSTAVNSADAVLEVIKEREKLEAENKKLRGFLNLKELK